MNEGPLDQFEASLTALQTSGFEPAQEPLLVFRGDTRGFQAIKEAGGFLPFTPGTASFRLDGAARFMVSASTDLSTAIGFALNPVTLQRTNQLGHEQGWVYACFLPAGSYFNIQDSDFTFLSTYAHEADTLAIPYENIIGAIKVENLERHCIHNYLPHLPDAIHKSKGCTQDYVQTFSIEPKKQWVNLDSYAHVPEPMKQAVELQFEAMIKNGLYFVRPEEEHSDYSRAIVHKYNQCQALTATVGKQNPSQLDLNREHDHDHALDPEIGKHFIMN